MPAKSAIYARKIKCKLDGTEFEMFNLYSSTRDQFQRVDELFDIPYYTNPKNDERFVNFLLLEVKVCPKCYFASNEPGHFITDSQWVKAVSWEPKTLTKLKEGAPPRRKIAGSSPTIAEEGRTLEEALTSYKLGIQVCTAMHASDPDHMAMEVMRAGNYALRAARLCTDAKRPEEERVNWLHIGLGYLRKSLEADVRGMVLYKSLYQLGSLGIYLGDDWAAGRAYQSMRKLSMTNPTHELNAYYSRLRRLWGDREEIRKDAEAKENGS